VQKHLARKPAQGLNDRTIYGVMTPQNTAKYRAFAGSGIPEKCLRGVDWSEQGLIWARPEELSELLSLPSIEGERKAIFDL
jgi:hypothetical protein